MDAAARIDGLEVEVARLQARVDELESALGVGFMPPLEWRLTQAEARVFGVLLARDIATKEAIMAGLYADVLKDRAEVKIVDVYVCKLRKKLQPFGITIETLWGQGYLLTPATKWAVLACLADSVAA